MEGTWPRGVRHLHDFFNPRQTLWAMPAQPHVPGPVSRDWAAVTGTLHTFPRGWQSTQACGISNKCSDPAPTQTAWFHWHEKQKMQSWSTTIRNQDSAVTTRDWGNIWGRKKKGFCWPPNVFCNPRVQVTCLGGVTWTVHQVVHLSHVPLSLCT